MTGRISFLPPRIRIGQKTAATWLLLGLLISASAVHGADRPNVLIILADDLSHGDLSACGAKVVQTPQIDRIFREGMTLTRFRANSSVCSPTRAALLTGCYPDRVGVPGVIRTHPDQNFGELAQAGVMILPARLAPLGYATALVGKWHLGLTPRNLPNSRGFEYFHGFLGDMMDDYQSHLRHGINYMRENSRTIEPRGHATDLFTDWAVAYLRDRGRDRRPFFLLLAYNAPHAPLQPPADWLDRLRRRAPDLDKTRARRLALVEHMDAGVGRVLDALAAAKLDNGTLVIFTSDNGGPLNAGAVNTPFRDGKGSMYEGGLRVPFAAKWPGHIAPRSSSDLAAVSVDVFATVEDVVHAPPRDGRATPIDGLSFLPTLLGRSQNFDRPVFFTRREGGRGYLGKSIDAVIEKDWKLLQNSPFGPLELFNLRDDPGETRNLAAREKEQVETLSRLLQRHVQDAGAVPWQK